MAHPLLDAVRRADHAALERAAAADPEALRHASLVVDAAQRADVATLELLLAHGGDPNASWRNYRPLHALIQETPHHGDPTVEPERLAALELLLRHGADPDRLGAWPLMRAPIAAALAGRRPLLDALLATNRRRDPTTASVSAGIDRDVTLAGQAARDPFVAAARGDESAVGAALAACPGFAQARDLGGLTALQIAAGSRLGGRHTTDPTTAAGLLAVARRLLAAGADPNALTRSWGHDVDVAYFACGGAGAAMLELLLRHGADPTRALPSACWRPGDPEGSDQESSELAELVLRFGPNLDAPQDDDGRPLLNDLVRWGQARWAGWLLERGASPNVADRRGWTALHQAASRGSRPLVETLLAHGADASRRDREDRRPIDLASSRHAATLRPLLSR